MKKIKIYNLVGSVEKNSYFLESNKKNPEDTILFKAMHIYKWTRVNIECFEPPAFELMSSQSGIKNYKFDISSASSPFYILSEKATEALNDILEPRGQFLPINTASKRKKFFGYYPTNVIRNAINIEKSGMKDHDYEVLGIKKNNLVFKEGTSLDDYLFSLSEDRKYVFVTEKFRQRVEEAGLKGFDFENTESYVYIE